MVLEFDFRKYGLYVWTPGQQTWVLAYFGFMQVIAELREDYREHGMCTCLEKKKLVELYNKP